MTIPVDALTILIRAKDDYNSPRADDDDENHILQTQVSHVQLPKNGEKYHDNHDDNTLRKNGLRTDVCAIQ